MTTAIKFKFPDILQRNSSDGTGPVQMFVGKDADHLQLAGTVRLTHEEMQDVIGLIIQSKTVDGDLEVNEAGDVTAVSGLIDAAPPEDEEPVVKVVAPRRRYAEDF